MLRAKTTSLVALKLATRWGSICWTFYKGSVTYSLTQHGVWKSLKKYPQSTLRAKRATLTWVDKSLLKMPKMVQFGEFLKTWSLRSNSVTRQVTFDRTKLVENTRMENNAIFWVIFKHCVAANITLYQNSTLCPKNSFKMRQTILKAGF